MARWTMTTGKVTIMNVVNNILELPKEYYMHHISGKTAEERYATAQAMIPKNKVGYFFAGHEHKASPCYLMLVDKLGLE